MMEVKKLEYFRIPLTLLMVFGPEMHTLIKNGITALLMDGQVTANNVFNIGRGKRYTWGPRLFHS